MFNFQRKSTRILDIQRNMHVPHTEGKIKNKQQELKVKILDSTEKYFKSVTLNMLQKVMESSFKNQMIPTDTIS